MKFLRNINKKSEILFKESGYPSIKLEPWRFTNTNNIKNLVDNHIFQKPNYKPVQFKKLKNCITIINGRYRSQFSNIDDSLLVTSISNQNNEHKKIINKFFNKIDASSNPFINQNTASFNEGVFIYVSRKNIKKLIDFEINHYAFKNGKNSSIHFPRIFIYLENDVDIEILEQFNFKDKNVPIFQNYVNEIYLNQNSSLKYSILQNEDNVNQINHWNINQFSSSNLQINYFGKSSELIRNNFDINLLGDNSGCELYTLCTGNNNDYIDIHSNINHMNKYTSSKIIAKSILKKNSKGVFNLKANIQSNANHSSAYQQNNNLLLSNDCRVHSNPQLEINIDEVQCKHGSTTGELDEDILFYLQSRGISKKQAKEIIIKSFANEIIEKYNHPSFIQLVENIISEWI